MDAAFLSFLPSFLPASYSCFMCSFTLTCSHLVTSKNSALNLQIIIKIIKIISNVIKMINNAIKIIIIKIIIKIFIVLLPARKNIYILIESAS